MMGNLYLKQRQFNQAVESFQEALRITPDSADSHLKLGKTCFYNLDDATNARLHLRQVLTLDPNHSHASGISEALAILE